jgi:PAS domain S-box-containing protein
MSKQGKSEELRIADKEKQKMNDELRSKKELIEELHKSQKEYDLLSTTYSKDISQHKLVEELLVKERTKYQELADSISDVFFAVDKNLRYTYWNKASERLTGISAENAIGKSLMEIFPDNEARQQVKELYLQVIESKKPQHLTVNYPGGIHIIHEISVYPIIEGVSIFVKDITERKQAERSLKESEEKFRSIMENSADAIFITDQQGKYVFTNKAVTDMLGFSSEEMKSMTILDITPKDKTAMYLEIFKHVLTEGKIFTEIELLKKDGNYISTDLNSVLLPGGQVYGSCRDITERKQREKALEESESSLRLAQKIAMMGNWELDLKNQKAKWSENCYVIYGLKPFEIEPTFEYFKSRIHPDDMHLVEEAFENVTRNKVHDISEMRIVFPDGTFKWFQTNIIPVFQEDKLVALKGINLDITERKQAEIKLAELYQFNSQIINSIDEGIIVYDSNLRFTVWNPFMEKLSGFPASQVLGNDTVELFPFLKDTGVIESLKRSLDGESDDPIDVPFNLPETGKSGWTTSRNMPFRNVNGDIIGVIGTVYDITDRKRAEQIIKENERKLLQLNIDKDRFISILGHDLKSPFNNLLGLSEVLREDLRKLDTDQIEDIANNINKSARSTYNLLEDILMWARTQQGKIPFKPQNLRFSDICKNILEILNPSAEVKRITINYLAPDEINIYADIDMLKTVLRNFVSNAIKFTNIGGAIKIGAEENSGNVTISVSDNGVGISPDNLSKLFDISQVLTTPGTAKETGTGLGLLLCKEFVEKHGGKIWAESEEGKGSEFKFTLPIFT